MNNPTIEKLKGQFPTAVQETGEFRGDVTLTVDREALPEAARFLRDDPDLQYNLLVDLTAVDGLKLGTTPRFTTVYELYSLPKNHSVRLKVPLPWDGADSMPRCPSLVGV